jgi:uncharacterized protein (TIGR00251 family)
MGTTGELPPCFSPHPEGSRLLIWAQPRSSRSEAAGLHDGRLKIRVAAPPVEDEANQELRRFLARSLRVPASSVRLVAGHRGKRKELVVLGVSPAELRCRLLPHTGTGA